MKKAFLLIALAATWSQPGRATAGELESVPEAAAVKRFGLKKKIQCFEDGEGTGGNIRVHEGDLHLAGNLVLDFNDQMETGEILYDPAWQGSQGLVVMGDLTVDGDVVNANGEFGVFLLVSGNLKANNLISGGSEIVVSGNAMITELVLGHYNHGILVVSGETRTQLVISDDHATEINTSAPVWNSHKDVVAMPLAEHLHSDLGTKLECVEHAETGLVVVEDSGVEKIISHVLAGKSALRQPADSRPQTSEEEWRRIVIIHGMAIRHVPKGLVDEEMCYDAVSEDGRALRCVGESMRTARICTAAVKQNGYSIQFVPHNLMSPDLCMAAVRDEGYLLEHIPAEARTQAVCVQAVLRDKQAVEHVPQKLLKSVLEETNDISLAR